MDWKQKRLNDLDTRLYQKIELLGDYEKQSDYEKEPSESRKLQDKIQEIKGEISKISAEYQQARKLIPEELQQSISDTSSGSDKIRQEFYDEYIRRKRKEEN